MYKLFQHLINNHFFVSCRYSLDPESVWAQKDDSTLRCDVRDYGIHVQLHWTELGYAKEAEVVVKEITNADIRAISQAISHTRPVQRLKDDFCEYVRAR